MKVTIEKAARYPFSPNIPIARSRIAVPAMPRWIPAKKSAARINESTAHSPESDSQFWLLLMGELVRRRGERHITRSAGNRHPGVRNRAEGDLTGGRAAGCRCSARGGDKDIDLLTDKRGKRARREFVDRLQHSCIHPLGRVPGQ